MAITRTSVKTVHTVTLTTKVTFTDEYDAEFVVAPTKAEVYFTDGKLDKIELIGDDENGMYTSALIRDRSRLTGRQRRVLSDILAVCED
jgi:hypothetical protein